MTGYASKSGQSPVESFQTESGTVSTSAKLLTGSVTFDNTYHPNTVVVSSGITSTDAAHAGIFGITGYTTDGNGDVTGFNYELRSQADYETTTGHWTVLGVPV